MLKLQPLLAACVATLVLVFLFVSRDSPTTTSTLKAESTSMPEAAPTPARVPASRVENTIANAPHPGTVGGISMGYPMPFAQLSADDTCTPVVRDKQAAEFKAFAKWVTVRNQAFGCYSEESVYRALWTVSPEKKGKVFVDIGANKGSCMSSPLFCRVLAVSFSCKCCPEVYRTMP